jgi:hypothetical protein
MTPGFPSWFLIILTVAQLKEGFYSFSWNALPQKWIYLILKRQYREPFQSRCLWGVNSNLDPDYVEFRTILFFSLVFLKKFEKGRQSVVPRHRWYIIISDENFLNNQRCLTHCWRHISGVSDITDSALALSETMRELSGIRSHQLMYSRY